MQCDECGYPLAKENVPSIWKDGEKRFCYVCRAMQATVSEREWFKTAHNERLEEQRRRWRQRTAATTMADASYVAHSPVTAPLMTQLAELLPKLLSPPAQQLIK